MNLSLQLPETIMGDALETIMGDALEDTMRISEDTRCALGDALGDELGDDMDIVVGNMPDYKAYDPMVLRSISDPIGRQDEEEDTLSCGQDSGYTGPNGVKPMALTRRPKLGKGDPSGHTQWVFEERVEPYTEDKYVLHTIQVGNVTIIIMIVLDGHGGNIVSIACKKIAERILITDPPIGDSVTYLNRLVEGMHSGIDEIRPRPKGGSTGIFAYITIEEGVATLTTASLGDSTCIVLRRNADGVYKVVFHSKSQDASDPDEQARILAINPRIRFDGVYMCKGYGRLQPSRGFGDYEYRPELSTEPVFESLVLKDGDVSITGCDGLLELFGAGNPAIQARIPERLADIEACVNANTDFSKLPTELQCSQANQAGQIYKAMHPSTTEAQLAAFIRNFLKNRDNFTVLCKRIVIGGKQMDTEKCALLRSKSA